MPVRVLQQRHSLVPVRDRLLNATPTCRCKPC
jgi:hypothetical protein